MCDKKNSVLFNDTECIVLSPNFKLIDESQVLLRVPRKNNMYNVDLKNIVPKGGLTCLFAKATSDESKLWHRRLGHLNFKTMNKLVKGNLVRGLPSKLFENDQTCVACQKGKQHRASCKSKTENSISLPLHLLHMDLFGPTFVKSLMKKMYCLVVTDDYSRFTWVFFLATKDETSGILKSFITGIENLVDHKVKVIRCDNGTEFKNREMNQFCEMKGILRQFSVARTPQQNRVAERRNRTLIEAARTMLADSKLPTTFWAEAVNTACYVQNRVLVVKPHNKTPYELFHVERWIVEKTVHIRLVESTPNGCRRDDEKKVNKDPRKESECNDQEKEDNVNNTNNVNAAGTNKVNVVGGKTSIELPFDPDMPALEDDSIFDFSIDDEDDCSVADMNNLDTTIQVNPIPTTRIHKDHPLNQVIGDLQSATQTRKMSKNLEEHRLVAQGYTQEEGIDNDEVFSPVARIEANRLFLAYASFKDFVVYQMDVKIAFLYGKIKEEVYICQPPGFEDPDCPDRVYKVKKALYGIHQAPRAWYETLLTYLLDNGFQRGKICQPKLGLWYPKDSAFDLVAYTDSDYARASLDMKSTTGGYQTESSCLSPKTTAWNEFSSAMTSAIICLATNQKLNFSKLIFDSMIRNLDNASGKILMYPRVTPLFPTLVVQNQSQMGEGSANLTDPHHIPTFIQPSPQPQKTQKPRKPKIKDTQIPQSSDPSDNVADEVVHKVLGDSLVRAATTAYSLEAEQDSGNIDKTQSKETPNESSSLGTTSGGGPRGNTLQSDEDRLKLDELMTLCTTLQNRVLDFEKTNTTQHNESASLKRRVKKLKKKNRSRTHKLKRLYKVGLTVRVESSDDEESLGEDASKQGRIDAIDADEEITLVSVVGDKVSTAKMKSTKPKKKGIVIQELGESKTKISLQLPSQQSYDKGKGILIEHVKKKDQILLDEETALNLQAKFDEEERLAREKAKKEQEANIALIETWNDIQAKIDVDHQLAERLQGQE
ncbi:putative ribonuclease H-like domain-containing protein [Tanacetum coccineum]|uniref:Ribonuclease H-like domain-containing protein n=1 Tax=Tanacetum coccineum TaxID=301880 RepID=A0ABQ5H5U4_9ASTR